MLGITRKCGGCNKFKAFFLVRHRWYKLPHGGPLARSNDKLCGRCFTRIKKMVEPK